MKLIQTCFLLILLTVIAVTNSLRCASLCAFIGIPVNSSKSWNASCPSTNQDHSQCTVFMRVDHEKRQATGRSGIETCTKISPRRMESLITVKSSLVSIVRYTCIDDYCDTNFLSETFPFDHIVRETNTTDIQESITNLIYNATENNNSISCTDNHSCPSGNLCQVKFKTDNNSDDLKINFTETISCIVPLKDDYLISITQDDWPNNITTIEMTFRCNLNNCINATTGEDFYKIIRNDYTIPLFNSSIPDNITTCSPKLSTGPSFFVLSCRLIIFTMTFLLFH